MVAAVRQGNHDVEGPVGQFAKGEQRRTYTVEEAAKVLGISRSLAYDEARRGTLPGLIKIGSRLLVSKEAIDRLLMSGAA